MWLMGWRVNIWQLTGFESFSFWIATFSVFIWAAGLHAWCVRTRLPIMSSSRPMPGLFSSYIWPWGPEEHLPVCEHVFKTAGIKLYCVSQLCQLSLTTLSALFSPSETTFLATLYLIETLAQFPRCNMLHIKRKPFQLLYLHLVTTRATFCPSFTLKLARKAS